MANAYLDGLRKFAANSMANQAAGKPTQYTSTAQRGGGAIVQSPPAPALGPQLNIPNFGAKPNPAPAPTQAFAKPPPTINPQQSQQTVLPSVNWGSNAGQPRPGNSPYASQPWQPAFGLQNYPQTNFEVSDNALRPPSAYPQMQNYPPQMRPPSAYPQMQSYPQPWQVGAQKPPQVSGTPPWMQFAQRPNYMQQSSMYQKQSLNPYNLPTQQMVRPMSPGQSYDSFMGAWQNPLASQIANSPSWRPPVQTPNIPAIPAFPTYQGLPSPWANQQPPTQMPQVQQPQVQQPPMYPPQYSHLRSWR